MAYVLHPWRLDALLLAAGPELAACREAEASARDEAAAVGVELETCARASSRPATGREAEGRDCVGGWGERLAWLLGGAAAGVVLGAVVVVWAGR